MQSLIPVADFLRCVSVNADRVRAYAPGGNGSNGTCDCIGLIIGAVQLAKGTWPGTHGSNWAARNVTADWKPAAASSLFPGALVFKARSPGQAGYALPAAYRQDPDQRDYYHVGAVLSVSPLEIIHCTSVAGGIQRDRSIKKWHFAAGLTLVDYAASKGGKTMNALYQAAVSAANGYPVKVRARPAADGKVLASLPVGTKVEVLEETNEGWALIRHGGVTGAMMRKFLQRISEEPASPVLAFIRQAEAALEEALAALQALMEELRA